VGGRPRRRDAQNALDELEAVAQKRRLTVDIEDGDSDPRIPILIAKLSADAPETANILMQLADIASIDPDNPIAIKNCNGITPVTNLLQHGSMVTREAAATVVLNICVPENELDIRAAGGVTALRALDFEGPPSAQSVATQVLETLMRLEADRRFDEAQKRAVWSDC